MTTDSCLSGFCLCRERKVNHTFDLFINEDLSKPENRVNVALFGMLQQDWFRKWFLKRLELPTNAVVYPPSNNGRGYRPDMKVVSPDGSVQAWIEVELGTDESQVARYREEFNEPIKTVWGKECDGGNLSLEEIADYLGSLPSENVTGQAALNSEYLYRLIQVGLKGHSRVGRGQVGCEIRTNDLVDKLVNRLEDKIKFTLGENVSPQEGYLKADTTNTTNNRGFSLRVKRRDDKPGTVALLSIHDGEFLTFPSRSKLNRCLPDHQSEIEEYMALIVGFGCNVDVDGNNARYRPRLSNDLDVVLSELDRLVHCLETLASCPKRP